MPAVSECFHDTAGIAMFQSLFLFLQKVSDFSEQFFLTRRLRFCGRRGGFFLLALKLHQRTHHQEHAERDNKEVEAGLQKRAVVERYFRNRTVIGNLSSDDQFQVCEVHSAREPANRRHNEVVDYRRYDVSERAAYNYADSHVNGVSFYCKFLEFLQKFRFSHKKVIFYTFYHVQK